MSGLLVVLMTTGLSLSGAAQNTNSKADDPVETIRRGNSQYQKANIRLRLPNSWFTRRR